MKRVIVLICLITTIFCTSCYERPIETIKGELFKQTINKGFFYDIAEYTLVTSRSISENTTIQNYYTFKLRSGHELILGEYYIFKVEHIDNGDFILKELKSGW